MNQFQKNNYRQFWEKRKYFRMLSGSMKPEIEKPEKELNWHKGN